MKSSFKEIMEIVGIVFDTVGVLVMVIGLVFAFYRFFVRGSGDEGAYQTMRQNVGKSILLGLEFLVAADIIRTVAISPNLESVTVLAIIVLIRTFLSMALEVELEGRWPWNRHQCSDS